MKTTEESAVRERQTAEPQFAAFVAIDWADQEHVWCLQVAGSEQSEKGRVKNTPEAVETWIAQLCQRFPTASIAVAIEKCRGRLILLLSRPFAVRRMAKMLREAIAGVQEADRLIEQAASAHPDFFLFDNLPGAGAVMAPRLLAAFGSQRERYNHASEMQSFSGIAAVRGQSGRTAWTHFRSGCPKFLRPDFSRMGRSFSSSLCLGAGLLPAATGPREIPPHCGSSSGFQVDPHPLSLLERSSPL